MAESTPVRRPVWLLGAIVLQGLILADAVKTPWLIVRQRADVFLVMGAVRASTLLSYGLLLSFALGASIVGLWRCKGWGWSLAFLVDVLALTVAVFGAVTNSRWNATALALYCVALVVLLFSPLHTCFAGSPSRLLSW